MGFILYIYKYPAVFVFFFLRGWFIHRGEAEGCLICYGLNQTNPGHHPMCMADEICHGSVYTSVLLEYEG